MQADGGGLGLVKEKAADGLANVRAQLRPRTARGEDVVREAFGDKAAVGLLRHGENKFHAPTVAKGSAPVNGAFRRRVSH